MVLAAIYMVIAGFAILSVLTGVVCDHMAVAAAKIEKANQTEGCKGKVGEIFEELDPNHTGFILKDKFQLFLEDEFLTEDVCEVANMEREDLSSIWFCLSKPCAKDSQNDSWGISKQDWIGGIMCSRRQASELSLRRLEKELFDLRSRGGAHPTAENSMGNLHDDIHKFPHFKLLSRGEWSIIHECD